MDRLPYIPVLAAYAYLTLGHLLPGLIGERGQRFMRPVAFVGLAMHLITLLLTAALVPHPPGFPDALAATSLGIICAYAWAAEGRQRVLGIMLAPLALVLLGTAMVVPGRRVVALAETGYSPWLPIHLGLIFMGIAGFGLAFVVGIAYLWVRSRLKRKQLGGIGSLPSLEVLDRIQFRAVLFGFVFLTLGIGAGGAWAAASFESSWSVDPKVVFTLVIWFWYGLALQMRLVAGRRGRWTALFSIVGFAGLLFSMLGMNFLLSGWHGYVP